MVLKVWSNWYTAESIKDLHFKSTKGEHKILIFIAIFTRQAFLSYLIADLFSSSLADMYTTKFGAYFIVFYDSALYGNKKGAKFYKIDARSTNFP